MTEALFLASLVCLPWLSFLGLCGEPDPAAEAARVAEITAAAENASVGTRFDVVQASLEGGALKVELTDLDACADGATIRSITRFVDLSHHRVQADPRSFERIGDEIKFFVYFIPVGEWAEHQPELSEEKDRILNAARSEVGWGEEAALIASRRFLEKYPRESLPAYTVFGSCPDGQSTSLKRDWIVFQTPDPEGLVEALNVLAVQYYRR